MTAGIQLLGQVVPVLGNQWPRMLVRSDVHALGAEDEASALQPQPVVKLGRGGHDTEGTKAPTERYGSSLERSSCARGGDHQACAGLTLNGHETGLRLVLEPSPRR